MKYFTISELTKSSTATRLGIDNTPGPVEEENLVALVEHILDPVRYNYGQPIVVNSGYRCEKLNTAVGGAKSSQHLTGQAADIESASRSKAENMKLFNMILGMNIPFDQLINEYDYDWVHVSFNSEGNRGQVLRAVKQNGKTIYQEV